MITTTKSNHQPYASTQVLRKAKATNEQTRKKQTNKETTNIQQNKTKQMYNNTNTKAKWDKPDNSTIIENTTKATTL